MGMVPGADSFKKGETGVPPLFFVICLIILNTFFPEILITANADLPGGVERAYIVSEYLDIFLGNKPIAYFSLLFQLFIWE